MNENVRVILKEHADVFKESIGRFIVEAVILEEVSVDDVNAWIKELSSNQSWAQERNFGHIANGFQRAINDIQKALSRGAIKKALGIGKDLAATVAKSQAFADSMVRGFEKIESIVELINAAKAKLPSDPFKSPEPEGPLGGVETQPLINILNKFFGKNRGQKELDKYVSIVANAIKPGGLFATLNIDIGQYVNPSSAARELIGGNTYSGLVEIANHSKTLRAAAKHVPPQAVVQAAQGQQQQPSQEQPRATQPTSQKQSKDNYIKNLSNLDNRTKNAHINSLIAKAQRAAKNDPEAAYALYSIT